MQRKQTEGARGSRSYDHVALLGKANRATQRMPERVVLVAVYISHACVCVGITEGGDLLSDFLSALDPLFFLSSFFLLFFSSYVFFFFCLFLVPSWRRCPSLATLSSVFPSCLLSLLFFSDRVPDLVLFGLVPSISCDRLDS